MRPAGSLNPRPRGPRKIPCPLAKCSHHPPSSSDDDDDDEEEEEEEEEEERLWRRTAAASWRVGLTAAERTTFAAQAGERRKKGLKNFCDQPSHAAACSSRARPHPPPLPPPLPPPPPVL